jgi:hypothetical protein
MRPEEIARANRLCQSILKRAFAGKLVPQDPNDEPASVLLERIHAAYTQVNFKTRVFVERIPLQILMKKLGFSFCTQYRREFSGVLILIRLY